MENKRDKLNNSNPANRSETRRFYKKKIFFIPLLVVLAIGFYGYMFYLGCFSSSMFNKPGQIDKNIFFESVAVNFGEPIICQKIGFNDIVGGGYGDSGYNVGNFWRSDCYYNAALKDGNVELCNKVKQKRNIFFMGGNLSKNSCLSAIAKAQGPEWQPTGADYFVEAVMKQMGYTDADVLKITEIANFDLYRRVDSFYKLIPKDNKFYAKAMALPSYDEPYNNQLIRPANANEYLYMRLSGEASSSAYCAKISPNAYFPFANNINTINKPGGEPARGSCYLGLSYQLDNPALCNEIASSSATGLVSEHFNPDKCKEVFAKYFQWGQQYWYPFTTLGDFPDAETFNEALSNLGDKMTIVLPPKSYLDFYDSLVKSSDTNLKQQFVDRVKKLTIQ